MGNKPLIVSLSGGKDSTAMLIKMLEYGEPISEVVYCDTTVEFPQMYEHLNLLERNTGINIVHLQDNHTYEYYLSEHVRTKGKLKGAKGYGFSGFGSRWCTNLLKKDVFNRYVKDKYGSINNVTICIGIAIDEPKRIKTELVAKKLVRYPLVEYGITEDAALKICLDRGYNWGGLYNKFKRVSCWCCPLQSLSDLRILYTDFPELWAKLKEFQKLSIHPFRTDYTLEGLEYLFNLNINFAHK